MNYTLDIHSPRRLRDDDKDNRPLSVFHKTTRDRDAGVSREVLPQTVAEEKAAQTQCRDCHWWKTLGRQWGRCESKRILQCIDAEPPLVTRDMFQCRFHRPTKVGAAACNGRRTTIRENPDTCGSRSPHEFRCSIK